MVADAYLALLRFHGFEVYRGFDYKPYGRGQVEMRPWWAVLVTKHGLYVDESQGDLRMAAIQFLDNVQSGKYRELV